MLYRLFIAQSLDIRNGFKYNGKNIIGFSYAGSTPPKKLDGTSTNVDGPLYFTYYTTNNDSLPDTSEFSNITEFDDDIELGYISETNFRDNVRPITLQEYNSNPGWCDNYDDDDFISSEMCCICGGGEMMENIVTPEVLAVGPNGEQQDCAGTCGGCAVEDANGECSGDSACQLVGDLNNDQAVNIVDVISLVNIVLSTSYNSAGDFNEDNVVNIVDIIFLVNIILGQ